MVLLTKYIHVYLNQLTKVYYNAESKNMTKLILFLLTSFFTVSVVAKPTYLDCDVSGGSETLKFSVMVDEDTGNATFTQENGFSFKSDAFFSPEKIKFSSGRSGSSIQVERIIEVSRIDLSASETVVIYGVDTTKLIKKGACKLLKPKKSQF